MNEYKHNRGKIVDNKLAAIVTSELFKPRVVQDKTKYKRKQKHKGFLDV